MAAEHVPHRTAPVVRALLFDADGEDRPLELDALVLDKRSERELVWIDIQAHDAAAMEAELQRLGLGDLPLARMLDAEHAPLFTHEAWFGGRALAPAVQREHDTYNGIPWLFAARDSVAITVHRIPIDFLAQMADHEDAGSRLGQLNADSFVAALLDRMLTVYFDEVDAFEDRLDKLEVEILEPHPRTTHLPQLRKLRRAVSVLRRLLSAQRDMFDAIQRPDFRPEQDARIEAQFRAVSARFGRAMGAVENARDLVIGSYELLSTRLSQRTNDTMRLLTFVTVLLGSLAVVAGVLGMNFQASLFQSGTRGFWITVCAMAASVLLAGVGARWRRWWK
jgi:Mg2+ and Co2+ transporter CorA